MEFADKNVYLAGLTAELRKEWPANRAVNLVFHGHSVPAGYFATPTVDTFNAYPHLVHTALKRRFPNAVINCIVTAIGGETSASGAKRFKSDVLTHRPDLIFIDYSLNDIGLGLERARTAWTSMINDASEAGVKVILLTPTPEKTYSPNDPAHPLAAHAAQVRSLASGFGVGLSDSLAAFDAHMLAGGHLGDVLSWINHPNRAGHELAAGRILEWFDC